MATFSVAALMKETPEVIARFADYYRRLGAERVFVYLDAAMDRVPDLGAGVELTVCDAAFWEACPAARPDDIEPRQSLIYGLAQARCDSDWLLLCDADEFVIDRIPVPEFLDRIPGDVASVRILPAEAVWGPGDDPDAPFGSTWFRRPALNRKRDALRAYGPWGVFLRDGLVGHTIGKQFIRRDVSFDRIDLHFSYLDDRRATRLASDLEADLGAVELAHYDAVSFERWHVKFARRMTAEGGTTLQRVSGRRRLQHRIFALCQRLGPRAERLLFRRMYGITARQARFLESRGLAFRHRLFDGAPPDRRPPG